MLPHTERILEMLDEDALVLDVGGWAAPFNGDWRVRAPRRFHRVARPVRRVAERVLNGLRS